MNTGSKGTAVITGASSGIGAIYADRLARRGHGLILVARNRERLDALATRLTSDTERSIKVIVADLNQKADLARVEEVLRIDSTITALVNNAGIGALGPLVESDVDKMEQMIDLNVTALVHLTYAIVPPFLQRGGGTIINIASIVGVGPEILNGVYGGTKAFVLAFSLSLHKELAKSNIRVQVVLPGATATDFWAIAGNPVEQLPSQIVMTAEDMVDAALAGLDLGELVTIPSLPDIADWEDYEAARQKMLPKLSLNSPAPRYGIPRKEAQRPPSAEQRLKELGIQLPAPPQPFGAYVEAVQTGNLLFLSGMLPTEGHGAKFIGRVGAELDVEAGRKAAHLAALNVLAVARQHLGSLDKVTRAVRLGVSVATAGDVRDQPKVADAASELLEDVFGKDKSPCRLVYGVASLPLGTPIELEVIFEVSA